MRKTLFIVGLFFAGCAVALFAGFGSAVADQRGKSATYSSDSADVELTLVGHGTICCKRGRHDWWASPRACWRAGGYRVANWHCRNDAYDYRICCKRGRHDWWTTPRSCWRSGGHQVSGWYCRHD